jgi:hypothetical protein
VIACDNANMRLHGQDDHKYKSFYYLYMSKKAKLLALLSFTLFAQELKPNPDIRVDFEPHLSANAVRSGLNSIA